MKNVDIKTVLDFGREWDSYDQSSIALDELRIHFNQYFSPFPWDAINPQSCGFDLGCGSGRWAQFVAPMVGRLHCIDASSVALEVARKKLRHLSNVEFHNASAGAIPFPTASMDFGFSLGVLHHVPDTRGAIRECARVLKPRAPLLLYLYYRFDNKPAWYVGLWRLSDMIRRAVCRMPFALKHGISYAIALLVYWPLSRTALLFEKLGCDVSNFPLANYRWQGVYSLKTDALDRFGTRIEQRFTRAEITHMLQESGLEHIRFRTEGPPFWCVSAKRSAAPVVE